MNEPRATYATDKSGTQPDRREQVNKPIDITAAANEIFDRIARQAVEIEQGKQARVELERENKELTILTDNMEHEIDALQGVVRDFSKITDFMSRRKDTVAGGFVPDLVIELIKRLEDERDGLRKTLRMANETTAMAQDRAWEKDKEIKYLKSEIERIKKESQFYIGSFPMQKGIIAEKEQEIDQLRALADRQQATIKEQSLEISARSGQKVAADHEIDKLRAAIAKQAEEIERLKSQPRVVAMGPDNPGLSYPVAVYPKILCHCDLCDISFKVRPEDEVQCPVCHGRGMNQRIVEFPAK